MKRAAACLTERQFSSCVRLFIPFWEIVLFQHEGKGGEGSSKNLGVTDVQHSETDSALKGSRPAALVAGCLCHVVADTRTHTHAHTRTHYTRITPSGPLLPCSWARVQEELAEDCVSCSYNCLTTSYYLLPTIRRKWRKIIVSFKICSVKSASLVTELIVSGPRS
jgi:hypothetical protein